MLETTPAAPQDAAPPRTDAETQQLVLQLVAREADALLRTARRHSLCADDAQDAYQRSMEILVRRAPTLDPARAARWLSVVVKHEAMALRRRRSEVVSPQDVDFERHEAIHSPSPEEQAIGADRTARAAEALQRLKPHQLRAMWLKALGKSYAEICDETGWSHTKVNRCLAEGRKTFLQRFAGIEAGEECARWQPALSALIDGEATAETMAELRPHLRNCASCRATLRALHDARAPLAAVLPVGLLAAGGGKLGELLDAALPAAASGGDGALAAGGGAASLLEVAASGGDAALAAGGGAGLAAAGGGASLTAAGSGASVAAGGSAGAGVFGFGVGGTKLATVVAAGAAVTAGGGGLVVAHEHRSAANVVRHAAAAGDSRTDTLALRLADRLTTVTASTGAGAATPAGGADRPQDVRSREAAEAASAERRAARLRLAARRREDGRVEFAPAGAEAAAPAPSSSTLARASAAATGPEIAASPPPTAAPSTAAAPEPVAPPAPTADSTSGEFAPRP